MEHELSLAKTLEFIKNSISDGFLLTDLKGNIIDSNEIFANYFEEKPKGLFGRNIQNFLDKTEYLFTSRFFEELSSQKRILYEAHFKVNAQLKLLNLNIALLYDSRNKPIEILFLIREIQDIFTPKAFSPDLNLVNIFEMFLNAILIIDFSNRIIFANLKAEELFQLDRQELIEKSITGILPGIENYISFNTAPNHKQRKSQLIETNFNLPNGTQHYLCVRSFPILEGFLIIVSDQTNRKHSENKLREFKEKYRFLVENAQEGIWVIDAEAKTRYVNQFMADMLGYSCEEMLGKSLLAFMDEGTIKLANLFLGRRQQGVKEIHDFEFLRKDQTKIFTSLKTAPIFDENGKYEGAFAFASDITEKRLIEQRLKESEEKYRLIIENANDLIVILNSKYEQEFINEKAYLKSMGYSKEDLFGKNAIEFLHPDDRKGAMEKLIEGFESGEGTEEVRVRRKDGTYAFLEIKGRTFKNEKGEQKAVLISRDITDRKQIEEAIKQSEEKYRVLFESSKDGIIFTDLIGNILEINQAFLDMLGYSKEEIKKLTYQQLTPQKWQDFEEAIVQNQILARGYSDTYEKEYIRKDGTVFPINLRVWSLKDEMGKPKGMWGFVRDITDQKRTEEKQRESEERFRTITEQSFMGIGILQDNTIQYANQKLGEIFGYTTDEMMKWPTSHCSILIHPDEKRRVMEQGRKKQASDNDVIPHYQFRGIKKSGDLIYLELFFKSIVLNGKPANLVMLNDITAKKAAEKKMGDLIEEIREQNQKLKELDKAKDEMLEIVSHELRTPLVSVSGFIELLSANNSNFTVDQIENLQILRRNADRLNQLIEKIFNLEAMELGKISLEIQTIDFHQLINSVLGESNYLLKQKKHKIFVDIPPKFEIQADEELMHQVLSNLLINAIKYTPDQGTISVKVKRYGLKTLFSLKDTGIGITQEDLPRLFQKFQRLASPEEKRIGDVKGIGLGLYFSKKIIELHGGKVWAESEGTNRGSTFYFELPNQI